MAQTLKKLNWEPMHDTVYSSIRDAIMGAQFEPGQKLSLRAIAGELGVSVMPVRAAVLRLVAEKALEQAGNGTFSLPILSQDQFREIMELRMVLEGRAARLAANTRSQLQLDEIEIQSRILTESGNARKGQRYVAAIRGFKFAVLDAAEAPVLRDLVESLWMRIGPFMSQYASDIAAQRISDRHEQITDAIARGDSARAEEEMRIDIQFGSEFLLSRLTEAE